MAAEKRQGGLPAPFLVKTHQMVEDVETDEIISWTEDGEAFVVWKPVEFARKLLPSQFKHNNFSSFVRQLNTYGFRKVVPERWEFASEHFRRGEQRLLSKIRRRKPPLPSTATQNKAVTTQSPSPPSNSSSKEEDLTSTSTTSSTPMTSQDHQDRQQQQLLSQENKKIREDNEVLGSELAQTRRHCNLLLGFLSKYVDTTTLVGKWSTTTTPEEARKEKRVEEGLKLFGVCLKRSRDETEEEERVEKRGRSDGDDVGGGERSWAEISSLLVQGTNQV